MPATLIVESLRPPAVGGPSARLRPPRMRARTVAQAVFVLTDFALLWLSTVAAWGLRFLLVEGGTPNAMARNADFLLLFSALVVLFAHTQKLYRGIQIRSPRQEALAVVKAVAMASVVLAASLFVSRALAVSRLVLGAAAVFSAAAMALWRYGWRRRQAARVACGRGGRNVLLFGDTRAGDALERHLQENRQLGYVVKGRLEGRARRVNGGEQPAGSGPCLGGLAQLGQVLRAHFIDEIFVVLPEQRQRVKAVVWEARRCGVGVRIIPDFYDGLAWGAPMEYVGLFPTVEVHERTHPVLALLLKRWLDAAGSAVGLLLTAPLLLLIALLVRLDSRGPALYRSPRIGRKGRTFTCYKFRTMVANAETLRPALRHLNQRRSVLFKMANDPRVTPVGRWLRKYSLDELPQLWNVLKGDMSLVGPRPPVPGEYRQYELRHLKRLDVLPGMTGLWQVEARRDPSFENYISLDTHYVDHWSLWLDCKILLRTVGAVAAGTGQ